MGPCERNADRWLDHLYGLLTREESLELADHLALCPSCRAGLAEAERDQRRMARAARVIRHVPEFRLPEEERAPVLAPAVAATSAAPALPATVPFSRPRRSLARRLWPAWAAAAAVLLAVLGGAELYRRGAHDRDQAVAKAKSELEQIDARLATLKQDAGAEQRTLLNQTKAETLRLFVVGPAQTSADAPYACRIATRDLDGRALPAQLDVRLVRADSGEVIHQQSVATIGETEVLIPAGLKLDKNVRLEVAAKRGASQAEVRETLSVAPTTHLLHLALNKSMCQLGEVVFFRALALERFSLKPPASPLPLRFTLVNALGKTVLEANASTGPGGIAGGEFALTDKLAPGMYTIRVAGAGADSLIQSQVRGLEIAERLSDFDVRPDRNIYRSGEKVVLDVNIRDEHGAGLKSQVFEIRTPRGEKKGKVSFLPNIHSITDAQGKAQVGFTIPESFRGSRFNLEFEVPGISKNSTDPRKVVKIKRSIAVAPSQLEIDFYPEGGDLVAGLPQRVFFRVRTPDGETMSPDGAVTLRSTRGVIYQSKDSESLGSFTFTPDAQETYTVEIPTGNGVSVIKEPFAKLGVKSEGIVLNAVNNVAREGDAVRLELARRGVDRQLLAVANCRGQIVAQQFIEPSATQAEIKLPAGVRGIVRLTMYEVRDQRLTPLAERLVYRTPAQRLDVKATPANFQPGRAAQLNIEARDEQGRPAAAWALALVVADQYRAERHEQSLAGNFLVMSDVGADLADAPLLADNSPATNAALELFLGTHGWRRFVSKGDEPAQFAKGDASGLLFSAVNLSPEQARALVAAKVEPGLANLQKRIDRDQSQLKDQREAAQASMAAALIARGEFERWPAEALRLALGVLAATALLAGGICLMVGFVWAARRQRSRSAFVGSLAAIGLCLVLYGSFGSVTPIVGITQEGDGQTAHAADSRIEVKLDNQQMAVAAAPLGDQVALAAPASNLAAPRRGTDPMEMVALLDATETPRAPARSNFVKQTQMLERFQEAQKNQQAMPAREFAQRNQPGFDAQPTLLWHPNLRLAQGQAQVAFDVPGAPTTYRVMIFGHGADGRFGFHESRQPLAK
jgi:hypothetical protein